MIIFSNSENFESYFQISQYITFYKNNLLINNKFFYSNLIIFQLLVI